MKDVLPPAVSKWQFVEEKARTVLEAFAFRELRTAGTLDRAYVVHARWEREPITRWYRLDQAGERPRLEAAVFGPGPPAADAELVAMTAGMLTDIGVPGGRRVVTVSADEPTRELLRGLAVAHDTGPANGALFFEVRAGQRRLAVGGRHDDLVAALGGPAVPALAVEVDLEAVVGALEEPDDSFEPPLVAFFVCDGPAARAWALKTAQRLRLDGVRAEIGLENAGAGADLDQQRARAAALNARLAIVVRETDLHAGHVLVEDHGTDRREVVAATEVETTVRQRVD